MFLTPRNHPAGFRQLFPQRRLQWGNQISSVLNSSTGNEAGGGDTHQVHHPWLEENGVTYCSHELRMGYTLQI